MSLSCGCVHCCHLWTWTLVVMLAASTRWAQAAAPATPSDRFMEDLSELRTSTTAVAEQLRGFNELYVGRLESRVVSIAGFMSGLQSNMDRLLERAHVWDTLQLHVAAWTEQMHTLSAKMDLLNRAQDNLSTLESKMGALSSLDYRLQTMSDRLEDADKKMDLVARGLHDFQRDVRETPVVGQFAARGALATLRVVERKVDRLSQQLNKCGRGPGGGRGAAGAGVADVQQVIATGSAEQLVVRCQTAPAAMDILRDVSAKVDVLFDRAANEVDEDDGDRNEASSEDDSRSRSHASPPPPGRRRGRGPSPSAPTAASGRGDRKRTPLQATSANEVEPSIVLDNLAAATSTPTFATTPLDDFTDSTDTPSTDSTPSSTESPTTLPSLGTEAPPQLFDGVPSSSAATPHGALLVAAPQPALTGSCNVSEALRTLTEAVRALTNSSQVAVEEACAAACGVPGALGARRRVSQPTVAARQPHPQLQVADGERAAEPGGCEDLVAHGLDSGSASGSASGVYLFHGHRVFCDMDTDGGGWTVVQRRGDWGEPRLNFSRTWADYRDGFGDPEREYWIGNKWLHRLSNDRNVTLRVDLWDWEGERAVARYDAFTVDSEERLFALALGKYSGNATDALSAHHGRAFSTWDANHDTAPSCCPCAASYGAGWWFYSCFEANLNGEFYTHPEEKEYYRGIIWEGWRGDYSLRAVVMLIRAGGGGPGGSGGPGGEASPRPSPDRGAAAADNASLSGNTTDPLVATSTVSKTTSQIANL